MRLLNQQIRTGGKKLTRSNAPITSHQIQASGATETSQYAFTATIFLRILLYNLLGMREHRIR